MTPGKAAAQAAFFVRVEYHHGMDCHGMRSDWPERLPPEFYAGLAQLNARRYYECHETLEALWLPERRTVRELYQGVLQIAVGCFHLTVRANLIGATRKLDAGARRLERMDVGGDLYGVRWQPLIEASDRLRTHLDALGAGGLATFDPARLPRAAYRVPEA